MKLLSEDRKLRIATREINSFLLHPVTLRRIRCCAQSLVELPLHFYIHCVYEQIGEHVQHLAQVAEAGGVLFRLEFDGLDLGSDVVHLVPQLRRGKFPQLLAQGLLQRAAVRFEAGAGAHQVWASGDARLNSEYRRPCRIF